MLQIIHGNKDSAKLQKILNRGIMETDAIEKQVKSILAAVKSEGDAALRRYTLQFDGADLADFEVTKAEFEQAFEEADPELVEALTAAKANIEAYHQKQLQAGYEIKDEKKLLKQVISPVERAGVYVPGGKAAYPSTVLMNVVPAKIAGVPDITMVTPPDKDGKIKGSLLVAAKLAGVDRVLKLGGAHGVGALAYGTASIQRVDKIVGPGNAYVAMAKHLVSGLVGIDMIAGPSEVVVLADETADPRYVVADLMAQAEHDEMASGIVITTSETLAKAVAELVPAMVSKQPRQDIIAAAFKDYGAIIVVESIDAGIDLVNTIAPEHLEILTKDPLALYPRIKHAGAVFLGAYTPESVGDYYAGTNHTLPTNATARFSSPLNVNDFQKKMSVVYYSKDALKSARRHIEAIADEEGLHAHGDAVRIRFSEEAKR